MISKTKYPVTNEEIKKMFQKAGFAEIGNIVPLGDGEYNSVYSVTADSKDYAVKIAPAPECEVLTYEKDMMQAEVFWYNTLSRNTDVCAPKIIFSDTSKEIVPADWFIMDKIEGTALRHCKLSGAEKDESKKAIIEMLAKMHGVTGEKFGYPEGEQFDDWYCALKSIIENLISDCAKKGYKCKHGEKMLAALKKHRNAFSDVDCTMVNFDLHTGNVIYDRENPNGKYWIVDLERGFWGDKIFDFVNIDMLNPMEKKTEAIKYYNSIARDKITVNDAVKLRYAMAQALMGLIMETEKYYRYTPHHFGWWRNVLACVYLYASAFRVLEK